MSHNPIFNRSMATGVQVARREVPQELVDAEFAKITSKTPMTLEGTAGKVLSLFAVVLVAASATWFFELYSLAFFAMLAAIPLGIWAAVSKTVRPGVMVAYAALQGVFVGGFSGMLEQAYPGIVQNAVLGTLTTAGIMFAAYRFGWIKVNARFTRVMTFAILGYAGFALVNLIVALVSGGSGIYSTSWGWLAALVGVGLAAFTLNLDFESVRVGVEQKLPQEKLPICCLDQIL